MHGTLKQVVIGVFVFVLIVFVGFLYLERDTVVEYVVDTGDGTTGFINTIANTEDEKPSALEVVQEVIADTPLRGPVAPQPNVELTSAGVLAWTNVERARVGLPPLTLNPLLSAAAVLKAQDMFKQQYFAHDSPQGVTAGDLAEQVGYEFILIGENLALGNYDGDRDLVQAWVDSPGHYANIVHERFTDIGIAVLEGTFEGDTVWMAVQEFGLPLSACPSPDASLVDMIDANKEALDDLEDEIEDMQEELEAHKPKYGPSYNKKVDAHNELVGMYNELVNETKVLINQYNSQVQVFNVCASE